MAEDHFRHFLKSLDSEGEHFFFLSSSWFPLPWVEQKITVNLRVCLIFWHATAMCSVPFSRSVTSNSATPWTGAYQASCPSPTPGACSNSCPSSQWCHPAISSSVVPFSSCLQSFPASGSFLMSLFFASDSQTIGVSASASVLLVNIQDWFILQFTGLISLQSKGLSRVFSSTTVQKHQLFHCGLTLTSTHDYWKSHSLD